MAFYLFNTSLLNKNINFFKKIKNKEKCTDTMLLNSMYIITQKKKKKKKKKKFNKCFSF